ncbi:MAG: translation initiation factor IF-2 N-terminal domain-containing protein, partial [Bacillota bacterium]|nr:translation initiation factor IF-2 N-terminal domain-containing protein [Bacillota bacterium]
MARVKIYELAKELKVESKDIIKKLNKLGVDVKNHMSSISEKDAEIIRSNFSASGKLLTDSGAEGFVPRVKRIPKA